MEVVVSASVPEPVVSGHASMRHPRFAEAKRELLAKAADAARTYAHVDALGGVDVEVLLTAFYGRVAYEDLAGRDPFDIAGPFLAQVESTVCRVPGAAVVQVTSPSTATTGWTSHHSVVQIVTDDMPFLVDSVTAELNREGRAIHLVVHPVFRVVRDAIGNLLRILSPGEHDDDAIAESWIHVEIDRESDGPDLVKTDHAVRRVLSDVREAVEDWERMTRKAREIADEVETAVLPVDASEVGETAALLRWLAEDNFTFLGYREYELVTSHGDDTLIAVPGSGLGILRGDVKKSTSFSQLAPQVRGKAREPHLMVLTKANSRSTVHRPAYLDYIGVKTFDDQGEVCGERRFLGLYTAGAYTQSVRMIPYLKNKLSELLTASGFPSGSHNARDLVQFVETYPRDELFTTDVPELLDVALQVQSMQERRQVRIFLRRDDFGRFMSCMVYLPRDRYSTAVRNAIESILLQAFNGTSVDYTARVSESVLARLHFVVRVERGSVVPDIDADELEQRIAEATRAWTDDLGDALVEACGEEEGARLSKEYLEAFPEVVQGGLRPSGRGLRHRPY